MKPTIGRIVIYNLTPEQQVKLGGNHCTHYENGTVTGSNKAVAIIVAVWSDTCVNLKVLGDSNNNLWVTSATQGDQLYQWNWPVIEK